MSAPMDHFTRIQIAHGQKQSLFKNKVVRLWSGGLRWPFRGGGGGVQLKFHPWIFVEY